MDINTTQLIGALVGCYLIAIVIVLFSGAVPTRWRTWPVIHAAAWAVPVMLLAASFLIAIPGLIAIIAIIAATSRPKA